MRNCTIVQGRFAKMTPYYALCPIFLLHFNFSYIIFSVTSSILHYFKKLLALQRYGISLRVMYVPAFMHLWDNTRILIFI